MELQLQRFTPSDAPGQQYNCSKQDEAKLLCFTNLFYQLISVNMKCNYRKLTRQLRHEQVRVIN